jgi:predicted ATPase
MKVIKIVVTGGPCAGKSTALAHIKERAESLGFRVLTVSETATELIGGGVAPWTCGRNAQYQDCHIRLQLAKEAAFASAAATMDATRMLIVCDRGLLDNKAYMTDAEFAEILSELGMTEQQWIDRYDAIFHLVTAALGAEAFYTTANNSARIETVEEARALDARVREAWSPHPRQIVIGNEGSFTDKMQRLLSEITRLLREVEE